MQAHQNWIKAHYEQLIKSYGGKWVIVEKDKIIFADDSFDIVFNQYKKIENKENCKIALIESGDAAFYGFKI
jgi:predicted O-methyltransferase YrrM